MRRERNSPPQSGQQRGPGLRSVANCLPGGKLLDWWAADSRAMLDQCARTYAMAVRAPWLGLKPCFRRKLRKLSDSRRGSIAWWLAVRQQNGNGNCRRRVTTRAEHDRSPPDSRHTTGRSTVRVEMPGLPLVELANVLAAKHQFSTGLPCGEDATAGGQSLAGIGTPTLRLKYGPARDFGSARSCGRQGTLRKSGVRVVKNVTGANDCTIADHGSIADAWG